MASQPLRTAKPSCVGATTTSRGLSRQQRIFAANRHKVLPTAIGRIPPHFLRRAVSLPPKSTGLTAEGTMPDKMWCAKTTKPTTKCDLCDASIVDGKEDALLCEGPCSKWFHRYCVGVPLSRFKDLVNSSKPFICPACSHVVNQAVVCQLQADLASLKDMVAVLSEEIRLLKATIATSQPYSESDDATAEKMCGHPTTTQLRYASVTSGDGNERAQQMTTSNQEIKTRFVPDRRYNVVSYGVEECPSGSSRFACLSSDLASVVSVFSALDSTIQSHSIKQCYRLGRFNPNNGINKPRPLLVRFVRMADVNCILSKRRNLSTHTLSNLI